METVSNNLSAGDVDRILKDRLGVGLYGLGKILALQIIYAFHPDKGAVLGRRPPMIKQRALEIKSRIINAEKRTREIIDEYHSVVLPGIHHRGYVSPDQEALIELFKTMRSHVEYLISLQKKGRSRNESIQVISLWVEYIRHKSGKARMPWKMLSDLYEWAWEKLKGIREGRILDPRGDLDSEYIRTQYYKHQLRWHELFGSRDYMHYLFNDEPDAIYFGNEHIYLNYDKRWFPNPSGPDRAVLRKRLAKEARLIIFPDLDMIRE